MITTKQKSTFIFAVPALLLSAAFLGNLFVEGWDWSPFDFIIAAVLLFGTAFFVNLVVNSKKEFFSKLMICVGILAALMLIWAELAIGIFGSPFAGS